MKPTKEWLFKEYWEADRSLRDIGNELGVYPQTVHSYLIDFGIPRRPRGNRYGRPHQDLTGQVFGFLNVQSQNVRDRTDKVTWLCSCACGNTTSVCTAELKNGHTTSCGCYGQAIQGLRNWKGYEQISGCYWGDVIRGAKVRGLTFNISIEEAWSLYVQQGGRCALSGAKIEFLRNRKLDPESQTASLDRIDSSLNYEIGNVHWVHKDINRMKHSFSLERFEELCEMVTVHRKSKVVSL